MSALLYYLIVLPISYLPLGILYKFSDFLFFVFTRIFQYRKAVILGNIQRSFPNKTQAEQQQLVKDFYRHFADILVEGVKNLSISREQLKKRMLVRNPEIMNELYQEKRNVILVSGHFNNWEWLISAQNLLFKHQAFGIGMPIQVYSFLMNPNQVEHLRFQYPKIIILLLVCLSYFILFNNA